jgi:hypothetical protein
MPNGVYLNISGVFPGEKPTSYHRRHWSPIEVKTRLAGKKTTLEDKGGFRFVVGFVGSIGRFERARAVMVQKGSHPPE